MWRHTVHAGLCIPTRTTIAVFMNPINVERPHSITSGDISAIFRSLDLTTMYYGFYVCSQRVKNRLYSSSSYCSNLYLCSVWAKYRKSSMSHFIVSYNNAFRIYLICIIMRCSASSRFANDVVDICST